MASFKTIFCCLAAVLSIASIAQAHMQNYPAFMWSGKERFAGKNQHFHRCDTRGLSNLVEEVVFESTKVNSPYFSVEHEKPQVFMAFVHPRLHSHEFLKYSGGFREDKKTPFTNLRNYVKESASSLVFPSCHAQDSFINSMDRISGRNPSSNSVRVHSHVGPEGSIDLATFKNDVSSFIKPDQTNFFVVTLDPRSQPAKQGEEWYAHVDNVMHEVMEQVQEATDGNYVAMLTSEHDQPRVRRTLMSANELQDDGKDNDEPNPWNPTNVSNNITSVSLTIAICFVFFFFIMWVGMQQLHDVKTAPHIVDSLGSTNNN